MNTCVVTLNFVQACRGDCEANIGVACSRASHSDPNFDLIVRLVVRTFSHVRGVGRSATTGQRLEPDVVWLNEAMQCS